MSSKIHNFALALLFLTGACDDDDTGGGSDTAATDAASTSQTSSTTTGDPSSTTGDLPTTGPTTESETTMDTTSGGLDPDFLAACEAYCEHAVACGKQPGVAECLSWCSGLDEQCTAKTQAYLVCAATMSCEELDGHFEDGPCSNETWEFVLCTSPDPLPCTDSGYQSDTECGLLLECPDAPAREFKCDTETCTCFEGGVQSAECPASGVCGMGDMIYNKQYECCGWDP
ncbi:hypothetical protein [Nannocystis punicea]|uniref:Uncharacterized protein n=1 Tax=Nannocystis punicea TaxID=2995304 RepID=A0ABY7GVY6_9BACT|nr:hypothetical protein [Nannocystis poenicansa]WAS91133.1 hypothetical protein O0S08_33520 [Nannocystis poenicansa]